MESGAINERTAIVIGASSGIGAATAKRLVRAGYKVALVARREDQLRKIAEQINAKLSTEAAFVFPHDVTEFASVPQFFDQIVEKLGGLGLIVYTSGTMAEVGPEEYDFEKDRQMMEVNLLGMMAWLNEAADFFSRMQGGVIVGIGSIAGDRGRKMNPAYHTSKGAQAIYLESLRNRLASKRVRVVTVKPGFVQTQMTAGKGNLLWMISADEAARQVVRAAEKSGGTVYVPGRWRLVSWVIRSIPSAIFKRLDI